MKKLGALFLALFTGAAFAASAIPAVSLEDPSYLIKRLDDPTMKGYLGGLIKSASKKVGVFDVSDSAYASGVAGTYELQDAITGEKLVIPAGSVIQSVMAYVPEAVVGGVTLAVGYSGSTGALMTAASATAYSLGALLDGVPDGTAANAIARTAETDLSLTLTGATATAGKAYFIIDVVPGLE